MFKAKLKAVYQDLTQSEKLVADYILEHIDEIKTITSHQLAAMAFWFRQRQKIRTFLQAHPLHEPYRCIDTTFFSEQEILSASLDKLTCCRYDEVLQAYHNDNPWEKTRPGYKGMHTVSVSTQQGAILIRVSDGQRAELLVRWINGKKAGNGTVQLEELDNWSVKTRF